MKVLAVFSEGQSVIREIEAATKEEAYTKARTMYESGEVTFGNESFSGFAIDTNMVIESI